jgi:AhpD family alkylhydroperoxidase
MVLNNNLKIKFMKLDGKTSRLIAIGASISANCQECLKVNIRKALENGSDEQEINEAIEIGKMVSRGAVSKINKFASDLSATHLTPGVINDGECRCE